MNLFQSLFYWMFYFNLLGVLNYFPPPFVSILILLDVLLQLIYNVFYFLPEFLFQSLFYWMFYFNILMQISFLQLLMRFNPYFTGCSTSTRNRDNLHRIFVRFQSLFYWMFYFNPLPVVLLVCHDRVSILILLDVLLQQ